MPTATADDWAVDRHPARGRARRARRLHRVASRSRPHGAASRRVRQVAAGHQRSAPTTSAPTASSRRSPATPAARTAAPARPALRADLERSAAARRRRVRRAGRLPARPSCCPAAPGPRRCRRASSTRCTRAHFLGAGIDLAETYEWGRPSSARITAEMGSTARADPARARPCQKPSSTSSGDPARQVEGTEALQRVDAGQVRRGRRSPRRHATSTSPSRSAGWSAASRRRTPAASTTPSRARTWSPGRDGCGGRCRRASPRSAPGASSRPSTTRACPGHHLQIAQTVYRARAAEPLAPAWLAGSSGHGEGWALYAERLMADLGYLDDPGDYLGMLDSQSTARRARGARHRRPLRLRRRRPRSAVGRGTTTRPGAFLTAHCTTGRGDSGASSSTATSAGPARRRRTRSASGSGCSCARRCRPARATRLRPRRPSTAARSTSARSDSTCCASRLGEFD